MVTCGIIDWVLIEGEVFSCGPSPLLDFESCKGVSSVFVVPFGPATLTSLFNVLLYYQSKKKMITSAMATIRCPLQYLDFSMLFFLLLSWGMLV